MSPDCVPNWSGGKKGKKEALRMSGMCGCLLSLLESLLKSLKVKGSNQRYRADILERNENKEYYCLYFIMRI